MKIYCCSCESDIKARLTNGGEIYPHRSDLSSLPFWKCDCCGNFVGCHHKSNNPTSPLGCIPTPEIKKHRQALHGIIDPVWKSGRMKRGDVYKELSRKLGFKYHTASLRSLDECRAAYKAIEEIKCSLLVVKS